MRENLAVSPQVAGPQNAARFRAAHNLILDGRYAPALALLEANMRETPHASDIDYSYGWATVCAANLGDLPRALEYYAIVQTRYYGVQRSDGMARSWESRLATARSAVAMRNDPGRDAALREMKRLDRIALELTMASVASLVRRAEQGDETAKEMLTFYPQSVINSVAERHLRFVDESSPEKPDVLNRKR